MNNEAQLYEAVSVWVKASEELPEHMMHQSIKVNGRPYSGYYDYSRKVFMLPNMGPSGLPVDDIEWLKVLPNHVAISVGRLRELEKCVNILERLSDQLTVDAFHPCVEFLCYDAKEAIINLSPNKTTKQ